MADEVQAEESAVDESEVPADETPATDEEAGAEGEAASEPAEGEKKPAGEPTEEDKAAVAAKAAKPAEIPEEVLKAAALKFANRTMAAARRAEQATERVKAENATIASQLKVHTDFVAELQANPFAALRKLGFKSVKDFVQRGIDAGGEPKEPTADDRVTQLEKIIKDRDEQAAKQAAEAQTAQAKRNLFDVLDGKAVESNGAKYHFPDRWDFAATDVGHDAVWEGIEAYTKQHGTCPDEAVLAIADGVERTLEAKFSNVKKFRQGQGAKTGQPAATKAAPAARTAGKTIANASSSGAPSSKEYSADWDESRKQMIAEMRAEGLI
jgi:hypothetical protein